MSNTKVDTSSKSGKIDRGFRRHLLIGPLPPPATGQSVSFDRLQRELSNRGWECRVINLTRGAWSASPVPSVARALKMSGLVASFCLNILKGYRSVYLTIAQSRSGFIRDALMIWFAATFRARLVVHLKGGNYDGFYRAQPSWVKGLIRATLLRTHQIIVLGHGLVDMYSFEPQLSERITVVANGLPERFEGTRKKHPGDALRILFLSNLIESKGYFCLLEAFRILKERGVKFHAFFAGEFVKSVDDETIITAQGAKAEFMNRVERYGLENNIKYLGSVSGNKKWKLLSDCHVFTLPTRYVNEGQPVSIIEAMAYGCPVITTKYRAIPDLVADGESGFFVEYNDADAIADRLQELTEDVSLYETMSHNAVEHYRNNFTLDAHLERILPIIEGGPQEQAGYNAKHFRGGS
ncbi:hypothetical protein CK501_04800 [Halovibrio salipaludis]|uniref:Glycosyl transferase family 1 domain-containing protein n=1 Tax=Halovibrio salipaludis TaxID=2032626 RepID=A0A2A2FCW7_9GAMM|nr:glycosyltransferase family 4 protein [Halovibrio salipaludis]PAU82462.1 hypothetical protein CK501_04800 [Halovibrio salipaludis]